MKWLSVIVALLISVTGPACAGGVQVIELFTSQSCANCRKADQLLQKFSQHHNVIALTEPVNYWDVLGWQDTLATPATSARLRAYTKIQHRDGLCTPQLLINGDHSLIGKRIAQLQYHLMKDFPLKNPGKMDIDVHQKPGNVFQLHISLKTPGHMRHTPDTIWVMTVQKAVRVQVTGGENKGKSLRYSNVVASILNAGQWNGKPQDISLSLPPNTNPGNAALIVFLQENGYGAIRAATYYSLSQIRK